MARPTPTDSEKLAWLLAYLNEHADTDYETGQTPNAEMAALAHYERWVEYGP
jgi:uncharacterized membrane protein